MRLPSTMKHNFSQVPRAEIPRSAFNRSCGLKTTFDSGYLIPIFVDEALPGDTFNLNTTGFCRMATPIYPLMDNMYLDLFFFAVPCRLLWRNWEKFNGAQDNPGDSTDYLVPTMDAPASTGFAEGSLSDYLGIPTQVPDLTIDSWWHRAYNMIFRDWFRDENLQDSPVVDTDDGPDDPTDYVLLRRGKRHDYFTSALPWPQKGDAVTLPLGDTAPVERVSNASEWRAYQSGSDTQWGNATGFTTGSTGLINLNPGSVGASFDPEGGLVANLADATAATINSLRQAFQIQRLLERDARGGTRYIEIIKSHFGVTSPDARLQRPEYLGGNSTPIIISPIAQTSQSDTTPQGTLAAMGTATSRGAGFTKSFTEHCVILGLANVRADLNYQQGLNRMFSRQTRYDFYWPALSHIGEQAILNKEIYAQDPANVDGNGDSYNDLVFGYQERYAEYRYKPSQVTGAFRSNAATSLDAWHLAQEFGSLPTLDDTFIQENPPVDRVIAVPSEPQFIGDFWFDLKTARPMPTYSVPGLIDHF